MKNITSVSGGKTSAYLAKHFPTDYNIFSLVRIEDERFKPKDEKLNWWFLPIVLRESDLF